MHFHIDHGGPDRVQGWLVPANPFAVPAVRVTLGGREAGTIAANGADPAIRANGWHATGHCRFGISGAEIPGFGTAPLRVYDADTNLLLYVDDLGRPAPDLRLCLSGIGIRGGLGLGHRLATAFRYAYTDAHNLPEEALGSVVRAAWMGSCLVAGRLRMPAWEGHLERAGFLTALLLPDPLVEMAERILHLAALGRGAPAWRLGDLAEGARRFAGLDVRRNADLKAALRFADAPTHRFLCDPATRLLGIETAGEELRPAHSINAIEVLSRIGVVGHEAHRAGFVAAVMERAGLAGAPPDLPGASDEALDLSVRLGGLKAARSLLAFDIPLAEMVRATCARAWAPDAALRRA